MLELVGSTTTQQSVNGPSSKIGVKDTPRLTVFQRPPNAVATYQTLEFLGSISMSATRPVTSPGPIERRAMPSSASALSAADGVWARSGTPEPIEQRANTGAIREHQRFMEAPGLRKGTMGTRSPEEV